MKSLSHVQLFATLWTVKRSNQSILKEFSAECSLEGLMLKLKLQYFGHLMQKADSSEKPWCWERLKAGGEGGDRGWDGWMASPARWTWVWASSGSWWWTERPSVLQSIGSQRVRHYWRTELKDHIPKQNRSDLCITLHYPIHCSQVESEQMCTTSFLFTKVDPGWLKDDDKDKSRELFSLGEV